MFINCTFIVKNIIKKINIIGSGIAGLAVAIRLSKKGYQVTIFEKNNYLGGKLSELKLGSFRFDKGPSLLTMPHLIDELSEGDPNLTLMPYTKLNTLTHYFFEDGTKIKATSTLNEFAKEISEKLNENETVVLNHLKKSAFYYKITSDLFLTQSLSKIKNFLNIKTLKGILCIPKLNLFRTMHYQNAITFKNKKTVQIFDRYATYNGSNPYKAPALLNIIPHLEFGFGAFLPKDGMHQITKHLHQLALSLGIEIKLNAHVEKINLQNNKVVGLTSNGVSYDCDSVLSDIDIHSVYEHLLPKEFKPKKLLSQEKSSSAYVFYFGINKEFNELDVHNILFSENYKEEFDCLFNEQKPYHDPTIYINITSKLCKLDAPSNCENWFVMINAPHNTSKEPITYGSELRKQVLAKINRMLKTNLESYIIEEAVLDPYEIEMQTSSVGGSLYGNASNNKFSAFLRHANFSSSIKGLFFLGGSVHPGGGIPLCLLSAKIVANLFPNQN